jgi:hypothetical protein
MLNADNSVSWWSKLILNSIIRSRDDVSFIIIHIDQCSGGCRILFKSNDSIKVEPFGGETDGQVSGAEIKIWKYTGQLAGGCKALLGDGIDDGFRIIKAETWVDGCQ